MTRLIVFCCVCLLSGFTFVACQNDGVHAGSESDEYMPRPAPVIDNSEIKGELVGIDTARKTIQVRLESGMLQTFKFDDDTVVVGLPKKKGASSNSAKARGLSGKAGSEVTIEWIDEDGAKLATNVKVTQLNARRNARR